VERVSSGSTPHTSETAPAVPALSEIKTPVTKWSA
jgi:hypothetical protein